jgi:hypothetical protein
MPTPLDDDYHKAYIFNESLHGHDAYGGIDESPKHDQGRRYFQSVLQLSCRGPSHLTLYSVADLDKVQRRLGQRHAQMYVLLHDSTSRD